MKAFMNEDFLLRTPAARRLYHDTAAKLPIIDYHCHIDPRDILEDKRYENITELWLGGDHYKWRLMRAAGVPESEITGGLRDNPRQVFKRWAEILPGAVGNPLYHWTHLELQRYFGIDEPLTAQNAQEIYDHCGKLLKDGLTVREILRRSNVALLCTTDDPADDLDAHRRLREDASLKTQVLPSYRPDKAMNVDKPGFGDYVRRLEGLTGRHLPHFTDLCRALEERADVFHELGCRTGDHALGYGFYREATGEELDRIYHKGLAEDSVSSSETEAFQSALLRTLGRKYAALGWVMQMHFGCLRNNNSLYFNRIGADTGFDAINGDSRPGGLMGLLDGLTRDGALPRMIFYSLNPADNAAIATMLNCFMADAGCRGKLQLGSAWWFNDHMRGMREQLQATAEAMRLGDFVGMLTDSRSFLSYTRHEYFRRIFCDLLGAWVHRGEYPDDRDALETMVRDVCYGNAVRLFGFDLPEF